MTTHLKLDKRYVWHPFTQHKNEKDQIVIVGGKGSYIFDDKGNEILDLISSWWTCTHGHANPEINQAIVEQINSIEHVMFGGYTHPWACELAQKVANKLPGDLNRVFFSDNGSTSIEVALKMAYQFFKNKGENRNKFIAFEGGYHGDTIGAMSVGQGCKFFNIYNDLMFEIKMLPYAAIEDGVDIENLENEIIEKFEKIISDNNNQICGIIVEPLLQGAGGMRICRPEFMQKIVNVARKNDILVIFDEVAVGFGRLGTMFACEKADVVPDIVCLSKALTAGYMAMSLTVARDYIFDNFLGDTFNNAFIHGHSFTANPIGCAIALKSLELFEKNNVINRICEIEKLYKTKIDIFKQFKNIKNPRCIGSAFAFEYIGDTQYKSKQSEELKKWYLNNNLNIRPIGNTVYFMPPYSISDEELEIGFEKTINGLKAVGIID